MTATTNWVKSPIGTAMQRLCGRCKAPMPSAGCRQMLIGKYVRFCCVACQQARPGLIVSKGRP